MTLEEFESVISIGDDCSIISKTDSSNWYHFPSVIYQGVNEEGLLVLTVNAPKSLCKCEIPLSSISEVEFKNNSKFICIKE